MFDIFPDQPSYEYPPLINVLYTLIWAFLLASVVAITHRATFKGEIYPINFFQSMILGGIVTAIVMLAIGDSLARGLGVFGAMAIIRFRTRIEDPRNVIFLFAALSTGIAIGVYGYTIAFAGTLVFGLAAGLMHFTRFRSRNQSDLLTFTLSDTVPLSVILEVIHKYCNESRQINITYNKKNEIRHDYFVVLHQLDEKNDFIKELSTIEGVINLKIGKTNLFSY